VKTGISQQGYVMTTPGQTGPLADGEFWSSPSAPTGRYGYGANFAVFASGQVWRDSGAAGADINDQNWDASPTGNPGQPSMSQTMIDRIAGTLMVTTIGINTNWQASNTYMQSGAWWWGGGAAQIRGLTIPPEWDGDKADCTYGNYPGDLNGPSCALPRFRYSVGANVTWTDGHAKWKKRGALSWCSDMFVKGATINPWNATYRDDSDQFLPGQPCDGYTQ
jgi:prepilin-type processing-associated H-X9-DG protein